MRTLIALKFLIAFTLFIAINAQAVIIEGSFRGKVLSVTTEKGDGTWEGYWDKDIKNTEAWGTFWFDTDDLPTYQEPYPWAGLYRTETNKWMHTTYYIGGKTYNISDFKLTEFEQDLSNEGLSYEYFEFSEDYKMESFFITDEAYYNYEYSKYMSSLIEIQSYSERLMNDIKVIPEFDWYWVDHPDDLAYANFVTGDYGPYDAKHFEVTILFDEFHIGARTPAQVPESFSIVLGFAAAAVLFLRRRFIKK